MKQIVQELRSTLGKMDLALGSIPESIVWIDQEGRLLWCNRSFTQLCGSRLAALRGRQLLSLLPLELNGERLSTEDHPVTRILAGEGREAREYRYWTQEDSLTL